MYCYILKTSNSVNKAKIGKTINIKNRLKALKTACPHVVNCEYIITTTDYNKLPPKSLEKYILKYHLNDIKMKGEWFTIDALNKVFPKMQKDKLIKIRKFYK